MSRSYARGRVWTAADPVALAVPLAEIAEHARELIEEQGASLAAMTRAATAMVEQSAQRLLSPRAAVLRLRGLPPRREAIDLPGGPVHGLPVITISGVTFAGAVQVFGDSPALMVPDADWPVVIEGGYPISIAYTVGHAEPPFDMVAAIKLLVGELNEQRRNGVPAAESRAVLSAESLLSQRRISPI